jgi:hypothetical protein
LPAKLIHVIIEIPREMPAKPPPIKVTYTFFLFHNFTLFSSL